MRLVVSYRITPMIVFYDLDNYGYDAGKWLMAVTLFNDYLNTISFQNNVYRHFAELTCFNYYW